MKRVCLALWRIFCIAALAAAALYYIYQTTYFSWLLLLLVFSLLAASLLLSLPMLWYGRVNLHCSPDLSSTEDGFSVSLKLRPPILPSEIRLKLRFRNRFTGTTQKHTVTLAPGTEEADLGQCRDFSMGAVEGVITRARVRDLSRLFPAAIPTGKKVKVFLLAAPLPLTDGEAELLRLSVDLYETAPLTENENADREWKDIRPYREGDSLRDIHWKLSSRREQIIVREYELPGGGVLPILLRWCGPAESLEKKVGKLLGLLAALEEEPVLWRLSVSCPGRTEELCARDREELFLLLCELLNVPCPAPDETPYEWTDAPEYALLAETDGLRLCGGTQPEEEA